MSSTPIVSGPSPAACAARRDRDRQRAALSRRLRRLRSVFDIDAILAQPLGAAEIVDYYEQCHDAYRKYHSADGAVHMALNEDGRFDPRGFAEQLHRIEQGWPTPPRDVLELAPGPGYNLTRLAARHPATRFTGIDMTPVHLATAADRVREAGLSNVTLTAGDFHHLPYPDASFDHVYCVEAFCYATDVPRAFAGIARVLRPGGTCTLFDGYLPRPLSELEPDEALAIELLARGMAMESLQVLGPFLQAAEAAGLRVAPPVVLDTAVLPNLRRLERVTGAVVLLPWLGRRMLARRSPMRGRNVLAGCLMRLAVEMGLLGYRHVVLHKPGAAA